MSKLGTAWKTDPGLVVSCGAHVGLLVFMLVNFAFPPHLEEPTEAVAVEMVTTSEMNQIMNGEEKAKQMPTPQRRVDKVADLEERKPAPPLAEAKKDTPPPPSPEKANDDPGQDDKKTEAVAAPPPPPPVPTPPVRPVAKAEPPKQAPEPPPRPEPVKPPPPDDAEALAPKPPPRPKAEPKETKEAKPEVKVAKVVPPPPPPRPETPPRKPEKQQKDSFDQVAKLLDSMKPPKPATKVRSGNEAKDQPHNDFSLDKITALLDHETPQRKASTGRQLTQLASLGSANSHADKMSPSMMAQLDGWLIDHYRGCWSYFGLGATQDYVPEVRVKMAQDGSLVGQPQLLNPTSDPNLRSLADSALRAVARCNPMAMPERFKPFYESWRQRVVRFDPKQMS